jgi:nucleotide-binding universal stress UspA family protein
MEDFTKHIIVPWDFTERAEQALAHAFLLQKGRVGIKLAHIVAKPTDVEPAKIKIQEVIDKVKAEKDFELTMVVRKGNIFKDLGKIAEEFNALLVVMGVHDSRNRRGLKVVVKSPVPFVLVKDFPKNAAYSEIVVPMNEDKKNRIMLNWVIILSKYYDANIDIFKPFLSNSVANTKMKGQLFFIKKNLDTNGIVYGVKTSKRDTNFAEEIFSFLDEIQADMMLLMSHTFKKYIKKVGENKTPILVINPLKAKLGGFS